MKPGREARTVSTVSQPLFSVKMMVKLFAESEDQGEPMREREGL